MSRVSANLLLLLAALIWGSAFVAQSTAMASIGPLLFTGLRFLIAAVCVAPFAWRESRNGEPALSLGHAKLFAIIGVVFFFAIALQQIALVVTSVTNAGFLTGLYVVMVPVLCLFAFRERPHPVVWPAAVASLAGIFLLGGGGLAGLNWGDGLLVLCAVFWAIHVALIGRAAALSGRPLMLSCAQFAVVGLLALFGGLLVEPLSWAAVRGAGFELFYTGVLSGGLAFTLQVIGQRWTRAADAAIILSSEALFAAIFGAVLLGERLTPAGLAGCALIFTAIVAVQLVPMLRRRPLPASE